MNNFIKISGFINIGAGLLLLGFWYLYAILLPYTKLSNTLSILVMDKQWGFARSYWYLHADCRGIRWPWDIRFFTFFVRISIVAGDFALGYNHLAYLGSL